EINAPMPTMGLADGIDPAVAEFDPRLSPDMENIRVSQNRLDTRKGTANWRALPGSGDVRLLADHYEAAGKRVRLAARGTGAAAALYDYVEGTDTQFQTTTGGTGLGGTAEPYFNGGTLNDSWYFLD